MDHISVLLNEVLEALSPKDGKIYFDGTFGGGGYTRAILNSCNCKVIACDRDPNVIKISDETKQTYLDRFLFEHDKFSNIKNILNKNDISSVDGIVLDLGVSNFQLTNPDRGFSFNLEGPVDMSMGLCDETALDVIRNYSEKELADIIYQYGEEHFSRRIAKNIKLNLSKIHTTCDLANIIRSCVRRSGKIDPSTKTFQALRIFVNRELDELNEVLDRALEVLSPGGALAIVSFHSLEDRIVKLFFRSLVTDKYNSPFELRNKKPLIASKEEIFNNPKSRSAKLRAIYKKPNL